MPLANSQLTDSHDTFIFDISQLPRLVKFMTFPAAPYSPHRIHRIFAIAQRPHCRLTLLLVLLLTPRCTPAQSVSRTPANQAPTHWIGTWAAAPQASVAGDVQTFRNQTLRLIVHTSAAGTQVRIRISNVFGDTPLLIGAAHIARRTTGADIDPVSDRALAFQQRPSIAVPAGSVAVSDPVALEVPALSDLAISLYLPENTKVTTMHILALQTNYVATQNGDLTAARNFPTDNTLTSWPFLTGVDVAASPRSATIVALGSSLTDGDGSTTDANRRWPDVLAERLQNAGDSSARLGVLNAGIIGNRLLSDSSSPRQAGGPPPLGPVFAQLGPALGQSGLARFERDVLAQPGVKYVIIGLGVNDILFPGSFIPASESVRSESLISGYRQLIARAHQQGVRVIGSTIPPFEHALFREPFFDGFYTPEKEQVRQEVNTWIRTSGEFDGVVDFDAAVRDPNHPTQLLPAYDSGDHLHVKDAGNVAQANAIPLALFSEH
jgi:lysophospholipase L1-like esterase